VASLVAVFAHPDDETFICGGTLAKYAAEGHSVALVCATRGEMGRRVGVPPMATRETIASVREQELRDACDALGIRTLRLLGLRDKTLEIQPLAMLTEKILHHYRSLHPRTVITFHEQHGGHPDHCAIGAAATRAFHTYKQEADCARLYHVVPPSRRKQTAPDLDVNGTPVCVDVTAYLRAKRQAYLAHRTQSGMYKWLWQDTDQSLQRLDRFEYLYESDGNSVTEPTSLLV
jgi:bacillithiol biosynthesis deacetylase BshB2